MLYKFIFLFIATIYGVSILGFLIPKLKAGIIPRKTSGLMGIVTSPFFHSNWKHLFSNTLPLIVLLFTLQYFYQNQTLYVLAMVIFVGGCLLWVLGRNANHIGASGLIYGLAGFMITQGLLSKESTQLLVAIFILILYGSLIKGVFPSFKKNTSWEGHLLYALTGALLAYFSNSDFLS